MSSDTMVSEGYKEEDDRLSYLDLPCCSSRPKGAYGTTDEAFVLILHVCLSQPDSNSNRLRTGGGGLAQGPGFGLLAAPTGLSPLCLGLES